jgi:hypothetical protein
VVLYVTAKTPDGKVIWTNEKIYMPLPQQFGRGDKMGRGPYEKSGLLKDTSLPPGRTVKETFYVPLYNETKQDGKLTRAIINHDVTVDVELWYLPYGKKEDPGNAQMWQKVSKKLLIEKGGK